jgi:hypothetical protein
LNAFLDLFAFDLVIGAVGACAGSFGVVLIISSPLSSKEFIHELPHASNKERLEILNVELTLYSLGRSIL